LPDFSRNQPGTILGLIVVALIRVYPFHCDRRLALAANRLLPRGFLPHMFRLEVFHLFLPSRPDHVSLQGLSGYSIAKFRRLLGFTRHETQHSLLVSFLLRSLNTNNAKDQHTISNHLVVKAFQDGLAQLRWVYLGCFGDLTIAAYVNAAAGSRAFSPSACASQAKKFSYFLGVAEPTRRLLDRVALVLLAKLALVANNSLNPRNLQKFLHATLIPRSGCLRMFV